MLGRKRPFLVLYNMGTASSANLARARQALADKVKMRRLRKQLEHRPRKEPDQRFALPLAERRRNWLRELGWRCTRCNKPVLVMRLWVFRPGKDPVCRWCHCLERVGGGLGRPRDPEPPADMVCPECSRKKPNRGQWKLKLGICRQCARRLAEKRGSADGTTVSE